jgi:hypothetical protein
MNDYDKKIDIVTCKFINNINSKKSNIYYRNMETYVSLKKEAFDNFSSEINKATPLSFRNGETAETDALEKSIIGKKDIYYNIKPPLFPSLQDTSCCINDELLYYDNACLIPKTFGTYKIFDNVFTDKKTFKSEKSADVEECSDSCLQTSGCVQSLYDKTLNICYMIKADKPGEEYHYSYSPHYSLINSPLAGNNPNPDPSAPFIKKIKSVLPKSKTKSTNDIIILSVFSVIAFIIIIVIIVLLIYYNYRKPTAVVQKPTAVVQKPTVPG